MAQIKATIEDYVAPERTQTPHEYQPYVQKLIDAGDGKVLTTKWDTESDALAFVKGMQKAASQLNVGARRKDLYQDDDGKVVVKVGVGAPITRNRNKTTNDAPAEEVSE